MSSSSAAALPIAYCPAEPAPGAGEERFRALIEHGTDLVSVVDAVGALCYVSPSVERVFGAPRGAMLGRDAFDFLHADDVHPMRARLATLVTMHGCEVPVEFRCAHADGRPRVFAGTAHNLLHVPDVAGVVVNVADVTERRALEAQLARAQKLEAVGILAGGIAHDFNNLLTVIRGNLDFAREAVAAGSQVAADLAECDAAATRATVLVRELLAFGGKEMRRPAVVDVNEIVVATETSARRVLGRGVAVYLVLARDLWPVHADARQIERVLGNLVENARDAMPDGGTLTIETENVALAAPLAQQRGLRAAGEYVRLAVRDTGTGLDEHARAHLFEPFFTTRGVGNGTGLGLAVVHGIVAQSGGAVHVESASGSGTCFHVYLPRVG